MSRQHRATKYSWNCEDGTWRKSRTTVAIGKQFARGGMRVVHEADEEGVPSVVKFSIIHKSMSDQKRSCLRDARTQSISEFYARLFNKITEVKEKVSFVMSDALELEDGRWANIEPRLGGNYEKHNNNAGAIITRNQTAQAFSHFTFHESHQQLLICDIQGVGGMYTDPQIHSATNESFGDGDLRAEGISRFLQTHKCNEICRAAKLPENKKYREGGGSSSMGMPPGMGMGGMGGGMPQMMEMMQRMGMGGAGRGHPMRQQARNAPQHPQSDVDLHRALQASRDDQNRQQAATRQQHRPSSSSRLSEDEQLARVLFDSQVM